jgi:DNA mismatch repair protein MutS2
MDNTSIQSLEFDKILKLLADKAQTKTGKEICLTLRPTSDSESFQLLMSETTEARQFLDTNENLRFSETHETKKFAELALLHGILSGEELYVLGNQLDNITKNKDSIHGHKEIPILSRYVSTIKNFSTITQAIFQKIEIGGEIKPNATSEYAAINRNIQEVRSHIYEKLTDILNSSSYGKMFQEAIITIRGGRYVVPLRAEYKSHFPCIVHDQSISGETLFVEPLSITPLNNDYKILLSKQKREIEKILQGLSEIVGVMGNDILSAISIMEKLDVIFAKALLSIDWKANEPIFVEKPMLKITNARHPLISSSSVVPINFEIGTDFHTLIITGPNTGGKTVTLKTAGLLVLLAYSGLHIPADCNSEIGKFSDILADIGEEQSIEQSLSSFSAHLKAIIHIISLACSDTLVLLDELGAGTDPDEGAALGMAIITLLHRNQVPLFVSTHLSLIKSFAYNFPKAENSCVGFDMETLKPTYKLMLGVPGQSHAFHIAEKLGMNLEIIETAEKYMTRTDLDSKKLIEGLERKAEELDTNLAKSEEIKLLMEAKQEDHEKELEEIKQQNLSIKENLLNKYSKEFNKLVIELKDKLSEMNRQEISNSQRQNIKKQLDEINLEFEDKMKQIELEVPALEVVEEDLGEFKIYDKVLLPSMKQEGIIIKLDHKTQAMEIQYRNGIRQTVSFKDVRKVISEPQVNEINLDHINKNRPIDQKIDVHGLRVEEAIPLIDKFLDDAYLAKISQVFILHGVGTGILRDEIKKLLRTHPHVDSYDSTPDHAAVTLKNEMIQGRKSK